MHRRTFLTALAASSGGLAAAVRPTAAADSQLEPGTWYDATVTDPTDGDTLDVELDSDGTAFNVRVVGIDTPEKSGFTRFDKTEEWEGIEDPAHLETWGNEATTFAQNELPVGTACQIALDPGTEEIDEFDRLLAKVRYDRTGDGSMDTVYNKYAVEQGYARVYSASTTTHDEYWAAEDAARDAGRGVWGQSDPSATPEVRDDAVAQTFHPHTSSVRTTSGAIADSRVPVWAASEATQQTNSGAVSYASGSVPLVGVDEANNLALLGGQPIQEDHEEASEHLEHFVFVANLVDHLAADGRSGMVLVDGGHHQFEGDHACSAEDVAFFQRYLEGQGIETAGINDLDTTVGPALADARALIVTSPQDPFAASEVSAVADFVANGGALVLMGSAGSPAGARSNLDALAADLGSDLRLNADSVTDAANNVGSEALVTTTNHNEADFSLWGPYSGTAQEYVVSISQVQRNAATLDGEYVDLANDGASSVDLSGWTMENEEGQTYSFPSGFTLAAGDTVRVHTGSGSDSGSDLYWGASSFRWDTDADTCTVRDGDGDVAADHSWEVPDVIIPTVSPDGATLNDEYVDFRNVSDDTVDLTGWTVEDAAGNSYAFPSGFSLASDATVRLHSGDGTDSDTDLYWGGSFVWNNGGDTVFLYDDAGSLVQSREYPAPYSVSITDISLSGDTLNDEYVDVTNDGSSILDMSGFALEDAAGNDYVFPDSFGLGAGETVRVHTGSGTDTGTDLYWGQGIPVWNNDGDTARVFDDNRVLAAEKHSSEVGGGTDSTISIATIHEDGATLNDEYVDFENTGSSDRDLTGWTVEDDAGHTYAFPDGFTLAAGATVRLHSGDGTDSSTDLYWGGSYIWNNSGDTVFLFEADGTQHASKSY